ncbi:MAG TPA: hypothetical protein VFD23_05300 [Clostridia bacterium]|nr:hypothetical protein [Clostridia bacterium]
MKKIIGLSITAAVLILTLVGCTTKPVALSAVGQWDLETVSTIDGDHLAVGKAYNSFEGFQGQKKDLSISFREDGTFVMKGSEESLQGDYAENKERTTIDALAIDMHFNSETKAEAVFGIRHYQEGEEQRTLLLTFDDAVYSFIKSEDI